MMVALLSFFRSPRQFTQWLRSLRTDWDNEGRYVGNGPFWTDGLNADGTRKDGNPIGHVRSWKEILTS